MMDLTEVSCIMKEGTTVRFTEDKKVFGSEEDIEKGDKFKIISPIGADDLELRSENGLEIVTTLSSLLESAQKVTELEEHIEEIVNE